MKSIKLSAIALTLIIILGLPGTVFAHQPSLVENTPIEISDPEISRAFYAVLGNSPHEYLVSSPTAFILYLNLLTPRLAKAERDFTLTVYELKGAERVFLKEIKTADFPWEPYYEEFAGDNYYMGPKWEEKAEAGTYLVTVSSPRTQVKYVLAVGKVESFPIGEIFRTLRTLPALKMDFFEGSFFDIFSGIIGKFLLGFVVLVLAVIGLLIFLIVRRARKRRSVA